MRHIISILMQNEAGALARVSGLFSSRGYNIRSLCVAPTEDETVSRLTMVTSGNQHVIDQIKRQLLKLVDVIDISELTAGEHMEMELLLLKMAAAADGTPERLAGQYHAEIIESTDATRTLRLLGNGLEVAALIQAADHEGEILETVKSGTAAIALGESILRLQQ